MGELQNILPGIDQNVFLQTRVVFPPGEFSKQHPTKLKHVALMYINSLILLFHWCSGSAQDRLGNPATEGAIIPVAPDRIPAPVPVNSNPGNHEMFYLKFQKIIHLFPGLVISIQAPGAVVFDVPAQVTFPNVENGTTPGNISTSCIPIV